MDDDGLIVPGRGVRDAVSRSAGGGPEENNDLVSVQGRRLAAKKTKSTAKSDGWLAPLWEENKAALRTRRLNWN